MQLLPVQAGEGAEAVSLIREHHTDWPARRVKSYGTLAVGQAVFYSRSKCYYRPDVAGEFEIVSLRPCESGVIVDMTDGANQVRCHAWISADERQHCSVDLRETFRVVRDAPRQAELRV